MSLDEALRDLARQQRCIFTTEQAHLLGATRAALQHRMRTGALIRIAPRLYCLGGVRLTTDMLLQAALLECGGNVAIGRESAAAFWRMPGFKLEPVHTLRWRDGEFRPTTLARRHTTRALPDTQLVDRDGITLTTPARTLFDLAPLVSLGRLERLLDRAWSHRLIDWRIMHRTLRELEQRGRPGIVAIRSLLAERPPEYVPPASGLESRFRKVLQDDGQSSMERQLNLGNDEMWLGRVDFIDRDRKLIVEVQSDLHHTSISDCRADAERRCGLEQAGWRVDEVREWDLWHRARAVAARVRTLRSG
jgi:very-short-patch-repair endonuclease